MANKKQVYNANNSKSGKFFNQGNHGSDKKQRNYANKRSPQRKSENIQPKRRADIQL
jgi:hypothetical protein